MKTLLGTLNEESANLKEHYKYMEQEGKKLDAHGILVLKSDDVNHEEIAEMRRKFKESIPTSPTTIEEKQELAIRHNQDKPQMDLLSPIAMFGTAQVLTKGLIKYPGSQWKKGMAWSKVIASLLRHTFKFMAGEDVDQESGLPHVDHMATNIMFLQEYYRRHKALDDRMKTGLE